MSATDYELGHRQTPPGVGVVTLAEDFGGGTPPPPDPPPTDDIAQARAELDKVIALQDDARYINRDADPNFAWTEIGEASRIAAIVRDRLAGFSGGTSARDALDHAAQSLSQALTRLDGA